MENGCASTKFTGSPPSFLHFLDAFFFLPVIIAVSSFCLARAIYYLHNKKQVGITLYMLTYRSGYSRFSPIIPAALYVIGHYDPRMTVLYSFIISS